MAEPLVREFEIVNQRGLHARASAKFVHLAARFGSRIKVSRDGREMDGKSVMGLLLLAAARGSTVVISADGGAELDALNALVALVEGKGEGLERPVV